MQQYKVYHTVSYYLLLFIIIFISTENTQISKYSAFLKSFAKYYKLTVVFMWNSGLKGLTTAFQYFFASINKAFILAGRLGTGLKFYGV